MDEIDENYYKNQPRINGALEPGQRLFQVEYINPFSFSIGDTSTF